MSSSRHNDKSAAALMPSTETSPSATESNIHFNSLPRDIIISIFSLLPAENTATLNRVCRLWHAATLDEQLWRRLTERDFPGDTKPSDKSWRAYYIEPYL
jgi:hypothetical protein